MTCKEEILSAILCALVSFSMQNKDKRKDEACPDKGAFWKRNDNYFHKNEQNLTSSRILVVCLSFLCYWERKLGQEPKIWLGLWPQPPNLWKLTAMDVVTKSRLQKRCPILVFQESLSQRFSLCLGRSQETLATQDVLRCRDKLLWLIGPELVSFSHDPQCIQIRAVDTIWKSNYSRQWEQQQLV